MRDIVEEWLAKCAAIYPDFGENDEPMFRAKVNLFTDLFSRAGLSEDDVIDGFLHHLSTSSKSPVPADILSLFTSITMYQMDGGPEGFGAVYHASHWYVKDQRRRGMQMSRYEVNVKAIDAVKKKQASELAIDTSVCYDADYEDESYDLRDKTIPRRIGYDH